MGKAAVLPLSLIIGGLMSWKDKVKEKEYKRQYYQEHKEKIAIQVKKRCQERKLQWVNFFRRIYSENPICQVCGRELQWKGERAEVVHFDHRHNGEVSIEITPSDWVRGYPCNLKNQRIWLSCDFGILCNVCNKRLPTKDREQWLRKAIRYTDKREDEGG